MSTYAETLFVRITEAAKQHGEDSELDHEVGDLREALRAAMNLLTREQLDDLEGELEEQIEEWS
jgi:hypothetical protein